MTRYEKINGHGAEPDDPGGYHCEQCELWVDLDDFRAAEDAARELML